MKEYMHREPEPPSLTEEGFAQLPVPVRLALLTAEIHAATHNWVSLPLPLADMAATLLETETGADSFELRIEYGTWQVWSGRTGQLAETLQPLFDAAPDDAVSTATAGIVNAAAMATRGEFHEAVDAYDTYLGHLRTATRKRKTDLPELLTLPYVLSLLAGSSRDDWEKALAFCRTEAGTRKGSTSTPLEVLVLAIEIKLGEVPRPEWLFRIHGETRHVYRLDLWILLMRAWLATDANPESLTDTEKAGVERLHAQLAELGLNVLAMQVSNAGAVLGGDQPEPGFFIGPVREEWRDALSALARLSEPDPAMPGSSKGSRLLWVVRLDHDGEVLEILPYEQKNGPRGWGKGAALPLARLDKQRDALSPADAAVVKALRRGHSTRDTSLDLATAIIGLIGHPNIEFDDAPGITVSLTESQPELDVVDARDSLVLQMVPQLRPASSSMWPRTTAEKEAEAALRLITVVRDTPQRARLIRFSPAQVRASQLIGKELVVPKRAVAELQRVLRGLGMHFQVHADGFDSGESDTDTSARAVPADSRLRAELTPQGDGINVRLVVTPMGLHGPRLTPGRGRTHIMAAVNGEPLSVDRDLALERENLDLVIDACPMLAASSGVATVSADWTIDSPDDALGLLELLPTLTQISGIDWPKGQPVTVDTATLAQMHVRLHSGREWLELQGGIKFDEQMVVSLQTLVQWSTQRESRFVPLGAGRYLALTSELRTRLQDLASVSQSSLKSGDVQVPHAAAGWLQTTLEGSRFDADRAFGDRLKRLADAQYIVPVLPATLQATFRPYQEEGYAWAMRLAQSGFGAVLADDMGLGKTLQALAVLLARSAGGPALVVAPTSLSGNWRAEARRFAPTLNVSVFGEEERDPLIDRAGPGDVLVVSYQLMQLNLPAFVARNWHTLVVDEAQAIKNASAKRSQAVFELQADFRLALSGTPIENRLAELWSIMRLCNAGLLGTLKQFNDRFANPIERDGNRLSQRTLRRLIAPFVLRRTKGEVLDDLPPRTEVSLLVESDEQERAHYEALRREAMTAVERSIASDKASEAHMNVLAQLTRLRRAACDPRLVSPQLQWVGAKVQAFGELAAELVANGHKALVFSQFVDFLSLLREPLDAAGIAYQYLDGSTPPAERTRRVEAFQSGVGEMFLISLKAGGFGLNLTLADYVVIADPWWNPAAEDQASGRAHRIGQLRPVTVYRLVNKGTLEERIVALHQRKRELADSVLEGGEGAATIRADELVALIRGGNAEFDEAVPGWSAD
ncbi:hypothetical protein BH09PSE5_BH09PSE5_49590 [soil metagenome]